MAFCLASSDHHLPFFFHFKMYKDVFIKYWQMEQNKVYPNILSLFSDNKSLVIRHKVLTPQRNTAYEHCRLNCV